MPRHESTWRAPGRGHPGASSASRGSSGGAGARADSSELSSWGWIRGWRERGPNSRSCPEIPVENSPEFRWKTALPPSIFPIFPLFPVFLPRGGGRASWAWDALSRAWISGAIPSLAQTPRGPGVGFPADAALGNAAGARDRGAPGAFPASAIPGFRPWSWAPGRFSWEKLTELSSSQTIPELRQNGMKSTAKKNPPSNPKSESWPIPFPWDGFIRENRGWERGLVGFGGGKELRDSSHSWWDSSHSRWDNSRIPAPAGNSGGSDPAWKIWEFLGKGRSRARLIPGSSRSRSRGFALGKGLPCGNSARPSHFPVLCLFPGNLWERPSPIPAPRPSQASRILGRFGFLSPHPGAQRVPKKQLRPELGFLEKPWNKTILGKGREIARARSCRRDTAIPKPFPAFPSPGSIPGSAQGAAWGSLG